GWPPFPAGPVGHSCCPGCACACLNVFREVGTVKSKCLGESPREIDFRHPASRGAEGRIIGIIVADVDQLSLYRKFSDVEGAAAILLNQYLGEVAQRQDL